MKQLNILKPNFHIFVCVNNREPAKELIKPSCGKRLDLNEFKELKIFVKQNYFPKIKLTKTYCLGLCNKEGIVVLVHPDNEYYIAKDLEEIKDLIKEKFESIN